jgi:hypothetical protein
MKSNTPAMTDTLVERLEASAKAPLAPWAREAILDGAAALKAQASRIAELEGALRLAGQHINDLRDEWSERDTTKDAFPDYIRKALEGNNPAHGKGE